MAVSEHWHKEWSNSRPTGYGNLDWTSDGTLAFGGLSQHQERRAACQPGHGPLPGASGVQNGRSSSVDPRP